ncbi:hypothetical protein [Streptacidiphilus fuscans]|uniref:hypothetical protein n=1 Tax=Streptacidiphilus fuscans TaxID=2789292 RepID=UPI002E2A83C5|nr:hypothetical protein [Streptacidiphilus fuscans]
MQKIEKLTFIGSTSEDGDCPSVYETETGDLVIQGDLVTDPDVVGQARHVKAQEGFVLVPRELLVRFAPRA